MRSLFVAVVSIAAVFATAAGARAGACTKNGTYFLCEEVTAAHGGPRYFHQDQEALQVADDGFHPRFLYVYNDSGSQILVVVGFATPSKPSGGGTQIHTVDDGDGFSINCSPIAYVQVATLGGGGNAYVVVED